METMDDDMKGVRVDQKALSDTRKALHDRLDIVSDRFKSIMRDDTEVGIFAQVSVAYPSIV